MKVDIKERFLCIPEIVHRTGMSKATIYNRINQGLFPKQIPIGAKLVAWLEREVQRSDYKTCGSALFHQSAFNCFSTTT